ncbi:MAG TPA: helix-turn-helix domain-containing protein [Pilimelia sp.]|nr:helix-turn-helix domain-containing protein [Pilimelia sp.]
MLTLPDREAISRGLAEGLPFKQIAVLIGRDPSIVSREIARHGGRCAYQAAAADTAASMARQRPKTWAVERVPGLREVVVARLRCGWSPASIAGRLAADYPH